MEGYITEGDPCVLKKYGSSDEIGGQSVIEVTYNEKDDSLLDVTIEADDDTLTVGDMVTANIIKQSEQYSYVVPLGAIHIGEGGTYLFALEETEGVLGVVLEAEKVSVRILEQNSDYAAISLDEAPEREIIVGSDRAVEAGGRIRRKIS